MSKIRRKTSETEVVITVRAGSGAATARTGSAFLDHMLVTLARYSGLDIDVEAAGDLRHHVVEDVAITLGTALRDEVPPACRRYGEATVPMDEALVQAVLDVGGRSFYQGPLPDALYDHFMRSFAGTAAATLHLRVLRGGDRHHVIEAAFKALGLALRQALRQTGTILSTKGVVQLERLEA